MFNKLASLAAAVLVCVVASNALAHYDVAPYLVDGQLLTGGKDHDGNSVEPSIYVYGFEFGEDAADPFNPADPGVQQAAGVGNLPQGAKLSYNVLSDLLYWNGESDTVGWSSPASAVITLGMNSSANDRTLTGTSGAQAGELIQSVSTGGYVHKHFVTSLFADSSLPSNVPGEVGYVEPEVGVYAFRLNLTLTLTDGTVYTSSPIWIVMNNGVSEESHDAAMASLAVPEPSSLAIFCVGAVGLCTACRRKK